MDQKLVGRWGEEQAARYLQKKGYSVTAVNYPCRFGEIDIIAENAEYLVFAEVKLRKRDDIVRPLEYVTPAKQRRLIRTAQMWLVEHETEKQPRFDVIEVTAQKGIFTKKILINHLENAFSDD